MTGVRNLVNLSEIGLYALNENTYAFNLNRTEMIQILLDQSYYSKISSEVKRYENNFGEYDYSSVSNIGMIYLYIHRKQGKRKDKTKKEYGRELLQFIEYFTLHNIFDIRSLKRSQMEDYQIWLEEKYEKRKTQAKKITILSSFLKWCFEENYLERDLTRGLAGVSLDKAQIPDREISPEALSSSLHFFDNDPKFQGLLLLLATSGLRLNEVVTPDWKDLYWDQERRKYYVRTKTKRDGERHAHIRNEVFQLLTEYRRRLGLATEIDPTDQTPFYPNRYGKRYTLTSLSALVSKKLAAANLRTESHHKATAHFLRHYFARAAFNNGASIGMIAKTLDHKSTQTTENYLSRELKKENDVSDFVSIPGFNGWNRL
ncbi:site-specific integrase (plasmid) [Paenibacillus sonchi]|uniref:Site-specific integrase n=1 Tax=Paenibacillus sonchi TaxID=373687 RepID=A0A974PIC9_9BACL|nr:site-specific integrase [Paenibacillus sonchi]QQZ64470.1 site-specific integrase [Paenibacillus sonchi]